MAQTKEQILKRMAELEPIVMMTRYYWVGKNGVYRVYNSKTRTIVLETEDDKECKKATLIANNNISVDHYVDVRNEYYSLQEDLINLERPKPEVKEEQRKKYARLFGYKNS